MRFLVITLLGLLLAGGCTQALPGASATPTGGPPAIQTAAPTSTTQPTQPTRPTPVAQPTQAPVDSPAGTPPGTPPGATLSATDEAVTGWLGTYCWQGVCADVPEPPPADALPLVQVADGSVPTLALATEPGFVSWNASYGDGSTEMTPLGQGGADYDPDTNATVPPLLGMATFDAPPPGDWIVLVQAFFVDGDAQYGWHVVVE